MSMLWRILLPCALPVAALLIYTGQYDGTPEVQTFLDRNGRVIGTLDPAYRGLQYWTTLKDIPSSLIERTVSTEDRWFYWHRGVNPLSVAKAAEENIARGRIVRGGSTITQQLAKNLMGSPPRTFLNKMRETALALGLEIKHSKGWILERYLNSVYYGRRSYGIAAAAQVYFGKALAELSPQEIDFLVGRPKAPSRSAPAKPVASLQSERDTALPPMASHLSSVPVARHFIEFVSQNSKASGPVIRTTLDLDLQTKLEDSIARLLAGRAYEDPKLTAALVAIDVKTGDVVAMVGSRDYFNDAIAGQVNAAVALRQPGSTLKPFTYFAAFAKGYTPDSIVSDEPIAFSAPGIEESEAYAPQNFDRRYHGEMTIREALANSYNVPAVATLNEVGLSSYHDLLKRFGFTTFERPPMHYGLAVTLGSGEVTLLELTNAYAALARGGAYLPYRITRQRTAAGPRVPETILPHADRYAAQVTDILSDPTARLKSFGFNEAMMIDGRDVAVKTGTSYEYRDNWTVGYTPSYAIGVWVGHADGSPLIPPDGSGPTTGSSGAAPLWHAAMESVLRGTVAEEFFHAVDPGRFRVGTHETAPEPLKSAKPWKIARPLPNMTFRVHPYLPIKHQKIAAAAEVGATGDLPLRWYLDGRFIASTRGDARLWIAPESGRHRLRAQAEDGSREEIAFRVVDDRD